MPNQNNLQWDNIKQLVTVPIDKKYRAVKNKWSYQVHTQMPPNGPDLTHQFWKVYLMRMDTGHTFSGLGMTDYFKSWVWGNNNSKAS
jgi:hypothetical protein